MNEVRILDTTGAVCARPIRGSVELLGESRHWGNLRRQDADAGATLERESEDLHMVGSENSGRKPPLRSQASDTPAR